ncbi:hypothetical protein OEZ85_013511 [Tetradesmus obliquus]|uniref:Cyclase n=1 Tax=Tetradesmus obliquus TaxID=3088 RepID=A0ABY8URW7_TETOB|nr:hypothetical protein OEZ85_013511 [Tetradesmus obliquus]
MVWLQRPRTSGVLLLLALSAAAVAAASCKHAAAPYIDVTVPVRAGMPIWESPRGLPKHWRTLHLQLADGDEVNQSWLNLDAHTGTHIDAPAHFLKGGSAIEDLDLDVLIGEVLVVEVPGGSNITAEVLQQLALPADVQRVMLKTDNTEKGLMAQRAFASNYTALDSTAAAHITGSSSIKLVGIDYLSIGMLEDIGETHRTLFKGGVVVIEGLDLSQVQRGWYHQMCLPAKLAGSDGAPVRCVLQQLVTVKHTEL